MAAGTAEVRDASGRSFADRASPGAADSGPVSVRTPVPAPPCFRAS